MTLAILDGQLASVGHEIYVVPVRAIVECLRPDPSCWGRVPGWGRVYMLRGHQVPVVSLRTLFGAPPGDPEGNELLVLVEGSGQTVALSVDALGRQQQVVLKRLDRNYRHVPGIAGATILGNGRIAMVLDTAHVVRGFANGAARGAA